MAKSKQITLKLTDYQHQKLQKFRDKQHPDCEGWYLICEPIITKKIIRVHLLNNKEGGKLQELLDSFKDKGIPDLKE
jgi:hypothetical protein